MSVSLATAARVVFLALSIGCAVDERDPALTLGGSGAAASGTSGAAAVDTLPGTPSAPEPPPGDGESGAVDGSSEGIDANAGSDPDEGIGDAPLEPSDLPPSQSTTPSGTPGISVTPSLLDFAGVEVGTASTPQTLTVRNVGTAPTGPLVLENAATGGLGVSNGCSGGLEPGGECQLQVQLTPPGAGLAQATLGVGNEAVGFADVPVRGEGRFRLSVELAGSGGRVSSADGAIDCGATCSMLAAPGAEIELRARTSNGFGSLVESWTEASCRTQPRCSVSVTQSRTLRVSFRTNPNNLAFVTSVTLPANLGGAAAYDRRCTELANQAGVLTTGRFVALMSDSTSHVRDRLSPASRGWVGLDGLPFIDTFDQLVADDVLYVPLRFDELGGDYWQRAGFIETFGNRTVLTGMLEDGSIRDDQFANTCLDWTSTVNMPGAGVGSLAGGPLTWTGGSGSCATASTVLCLEDGKSAPLTIARAAGKQMWVTTTAFAVGSMTPDAKCQLEKPANVLNARAYISTTTRAAVALLEPNTTYVRPDGLVVGTGAELARGVLPIAPVWHHPDGTPDNSSMWTGSASPTQAGTAASTCNDWTNPAGTGDTGVCGFGGPMQWNFFPQQECAREVDRLYCVEQ